LIPRSIVDTSKLKMVFWELTTACNLKCAHCRACSVHQRSPDDLSTAESKALLDEIAKLGPVSVVLSGGEPLARPDVFEIAAYGSSKSLRMLLATNGTLLTSEVARRIVEAGIGRVSISIDGATATSHDSFRGVEGAFEQAWAGVEHLKRVGAPYQINTTISKHNIAEIPDILRLAVERGASALHIFLLVPTGCGKEIADEEMIEPEDYERVLNWLYDQSKEVPIHLKATCAPHYFRVIHKRAKEEGIKPTAIAHGHDSVTKGCLAGSSVCFISHKGEVYPCGYLPVSAGNVRNTSFWTIWENAEVFRVLRDENNLKGKCGVCEYRKVCMGCRARAYAYTGDYMTSEPYCVYEPKSRQSAPSTQVGMHY